MTDVSYLLKVGRNHENGDASLQNPDEECVNFGLRTYINTNCGFFQDQDLGGEFKPLSDDYLLLVPAAQGFDCLLGSPWPDVVSPYPNFCFGFFLVLGDDSAQDR